MMHTNQTTNQARDTLHLTQMAKGSCLAKVLEATALKDSLANLDDTTLAKDAAQGMITMGEAVGALMMVTIFDQAWAQHVAKKFGLWESLIEAIEGNGKVIDLSVKTDHGRRMFDNFGVAINPA